MQAYHVGILVRDLDAAIERFSTALGLTFAPIAGMETEMHGAMEGTFFTRATYSTEGPMYLELVQGDESAPKENMFSLKNGEGLHHIGVWTGDFATHKATPTCLPVMSTIHMAPGDPTMWLSDPAELHGVRVEFVNEAIMKPGLEAWLRGKLPPGA